MRIETSIITSLSELRDIEKQRIADEKAAADREQRAAIEAKRAAEQAIVDEEKERKRAEREEIIKIQLAQAELERQARMRVVAEVAAEQARLQAQLDEVRMREELELRRVEVAKKRPTWMVVVTAIAFAAACGLTWFAVERSREKDIAEQKRAAALALANQAQQEQAEMVRKLAELELAIDEQDKLLTKAQKSLLAAQSKADIAKAKADIDAANKAKAIARQRAWEIEQQRLHEERVKVLDVSKCTGTALGCLKHN
jgi:hypothetical protein